MGEMAYSPSGQLVIFLAPGQIGKGAAVNTIRKADILVVDDHELVRRGLRHLINGTDDMQVCCEAATVAEAMQHLAEKRPSLAIIDLSLPDGNGIELIKRLSTRYEDMHLLVSSMHDEELFAERALMAGAMGYINKQETAERVLDAIRRILLGKVYLSPRMRKRLSAASPCYKFKTTTSTSPIERLSDRELEVFELIGRGHRTAEIAESLHLSIKTIETYRAHIKQKLKLETSTALIANAVQWTLEQH
jgi:DNA-binding NarL/FixJ family response regulator